MKNQTNKVQKVCFTCVACGCRLLAHCWHVDAGNFAPSVAPTQIERKKWIFIRRSVPLESDV